MGKKTFIAAFVILLALTLSIGAQGANVTRANPLPDRAPYPPTVAIISPTNATYNQSRVPLTANVWNLGSYFPMAYHLDVVYYIVDNEVGGCFSTNPVNGTQYSTDLSGLSNGEHNVTVHAYATGCYYGSEMQILDWAADSTDTATFMVNDSSQASQTAPSSEGLAFPDGLTVYSPLNATYNVNSLPCNVTFSCAYGIQTKLNYSLDGVFQGYGIGAFGVSNLTQLADGPHRLTIGIQEGFSGSTYPSETYFTRADIVDFTVDTSPPSITIVQPENATYSGDTGFTLAVNVSEPFSWMGYSIDGQANVTFAKSMGISGAATGLNDGSHNITVYANDTAGNMAKPETVYFTQVTSHATVTPTQSPTPKETPTQQPTVASSPTPIIDHSYGWIPYVIVLVVVAALATLAIYIRRRRRK